jgi:hypothetical protein
MTSVPSENILKLRALTEQMCLQGPDDDYKQVVSQLKEIIDICREEIENTKNTKTKIKCYETMCFSMANILNNIKTF